MRTMLQHRDLDGVRLAHHGTVDGRAPRPRLAALDLQVEDALQVHDVRGRHVALIEQERDVADPARDQGRRFGRARALGLSLGTCPRCSCAAGRG